MNGLAWAHRPASPHLHVPTAKQGTTRVKPIRHLPRPSTSKPSDAKVLDPEDKHIDADDIFGEGDRGLGIYRLPGSKSRYGQRERWGQIQYAMRAILTIYHGLPPAHFNATQLTDKVQNELAKDPQYCAAKVSRQTVLRAVKQLRADNQPPE
jgi:hypothetical protein